MKTYIVKVNDDLPESIDIIKAINRMMETINHEDDYLGCTCDIHKASTFVRISVALGFRKKQSKVFDFYDGIMRIMKKINSNLKEVDSSGRRISNDVYEYLIQYEHVFAISNMAINDIADAISIVCKNDIMSISANNFDEDDIMNLVKHVTIDILHQYMHRYQYSDKQTEQLFHNAKLYANVDNDLYNHLNDISDEIEQSYINDIKQVNVNNIDTRYASAIYSLPDFAIKYNTQFKYMFPKSYNLLITLTNKAEKIRQEYLQKLQQKRDKYKLTSEYLLKHYFSVFIGQLSSLRKSNNNEQKQKVIEKILQLYEKTQNLQIDDTINQSDKEYYLQSMRNNMNKLNIKYN